MASSKNNPVLPNSQPLLQPQSAPALVQHYLHSPQTANSQPMHPQHPHSQPSHMSTSNLSPPRSQLESGFPVRVNVISITVNDLRSVHIMKKNSPRMNVACGNIIFYLGCSLLFLKKVFCFLNY